MSIADRKQFRDLGQGESHLEDFFDLVRDTRPFAANRVGEPSPNLVDVEAIHARKFDELVRRARQAFTEPRGIGVTLTGQAGTGKSHLLTRFYNWANQKSSKDSTHALYVYVHSMIGDPDRLPRYLLKTVISVLSRGGRQPLHKSPLFRLIDHGVRHALQEAGAASTEMTIKHGGRAFKAFLSRTGIDGEIADGLVGFYRHAYPIPNADAGRDFLAASAIAWLSGDEIDAEFAGFLDLKARGSESASLRDDQQVAQVLLALCRMAALAHQPFILALDQLDVLDPDRIGSLSRFLQVLLDQVPNLLVIVSGNKEALEGYRNAGVISEAAWDRLAEFEIRLERITRVDARRILEARLERFLEPFMQIESIRYHVGTDTLFPLGRGWLEQCLGEGLDFRPRQVLTWARDAWEDQQAALERLGGEEWLRRWPNLGTVAETGGGKQTDQPTPEDIAAAIDEKVDRKIQEQIEQHRLQPGSLPPDAGNLTGLVLALLEQCRGHENTYTFRDIQRKSKERGRLPAYDLLVRERRVPDESEVTTGIAFVTNSGRSATMALSRLLSCDPAPHHRLLVTDEERRPLKVGAQGVAYYANLKKLGKDAFQHIELTFQDYALLDALEGVVAQARVGDLDVEIPRGTIRTVTEAEVIASHHRRDRYRSHPLLRHLLTEEAAPPTTPKTNVPKIDKNDARQFIMAQLAWMMGTTDLALAKGYVKTKSALKLEPEPTREAFRGIIETLHAEGLVYATPQESDIYVQLLGK